MPNLRSFLGIPFSTGTIPEIVDLIVAAARAEKTSMLVTPNVQHIVALENQVSREERDTYLSADLFLCDSKIINRLARWSGLDLSPRTGTDRVEDVLAAPGNRDLVIAVAGPTPEQTAALSARHPDWTFRHIDTPAKLVRGTPEWDRCVAEAASANWQILLSCLSFPKQEMFSADVRAARHSAGGVIMGVGAAVDFISGTAVRAPMGFQRLGLEWLHRLLSDPVRLWRRYLVDGPRIFLIYARRVRAGSR